MPINPYKPLFPEALSLEVIKQLQYIVDNPEKSSAGEVKAAQEKLRKARGTVSPKKPQAVPYVAPKDFKWAGKEFQEVDEDELLLDVESPQENPVLRKIFADFRKELKTNPKILSVYQQKENPHLLAITLPWNHRTSGFTAKLDAYDGNTVKYLGYTTGKDYTAIIFKYLF